MTVDFDLHGRVRLRLVDAPDAAIAAVTADTGLPAVAGSGDAAIVVEFVAEIPLTEPVRRIGRDAGFSGDSYLVGGAAGSRTLLMPDATDAVRLRCEPGVRHIPELLALLNLVALDAGLLPLHAAAVVHHGVGILATGWSKGGKTELVLALMARGATFVADEWCYVVPDERRVLGLAHPVRVWDWQLRQLPRLRATLTRKQRARLAATRALARLDPVEPRLAPTLGVSAPPADLFGAEHLAAECAADRLVLVEARDTTRIEARAVEPVEVAARMRASLCAERSGLVAESLRARYAFPDRPWPRLDAAPGREATLLTRAFTGLPAWTLSHPYPVELAGLAEAVERLG